MTLYLIGRRKFKFLRHRLCLRSLRIRFKSLARVTAWQHRHGHMSTSNGQVVQGADTHNHVLLIEPEEVVFTNVRINQVQS